MNERIRKLLNKATSGLEPDLSPQRTVTLNEMEKFAELIVKECAGIAKHHVMNISTYADADFVDEQIKQHFGVEE